MPNDPSLVGNFGFRIQAACASTDPATSSNCFVAGDRTNVVVQ